MLKKDHVYVVTEDNQFIEVEASVIDNPLSFSMLQDINNLAPGVQAEFMGKKVKDILRPVK